MVGRPSALSGFALSPDGRYVGTIIGDFAVLKADLWLFDSQRGTSLPLTFERGLGGGLPVFSPDGTSIAFSYSRGDVGTIVKKSTSGTGPEEKLFESKLLEPNSRIGVADWSRDGKYLAYAVTDPQLRSDIWILPLAGDRKPFPFLNTPASERYPKFSPDGKWIAYTSDDGGATGGSTSQIYVQPFAPEASNPSRWPISVNGGLAPRWRGDGKELFYLEGRKLMAAEIRTPGRNFEAGIPRELFEAPPQDSAPAIFGVSADGERFLLPVQVESETAIPITVVSNWTAGIQK